MRLCVYSNGRTLPPTSCSVSGNLTDTTTTQGARHAGQTHCTHYGEETQIARSVQLPEMSRAPTSKPLEQPCREHCVLTAILGDYRRFQDRALRYHNTPRWKTEKRPGMPVIQWTHPICVLFLDSHAIREIFLRRDRPAEKSGRRIVRHVCRSGSSPREKRLRGALARHANYV